MTPQQWNGFQPQAYFCRPAYGYLKVHPAPPSFSMETSDEVYNESDYWKVAERIRFFRRLKATHDLAGRPLKARSNVIRRKMYRWDCKYVTTEQLQAYEEAIKQMKWMMRQSAPAELVKLHGTLARELNATKWRVSNIYAGRCAERTQVHVAF